MSELSWANEKWFCADLEDKRAAAFCLLKGSCSWKFNIWNWVGQILQLQKGPVSKKQDAVEAGSQVTSKKVQVFC